MMKVHRTRAGVLLLVYGDQVLELPATAAIELRNWLGAELGFEPVEGARGSSWQQGYEAGYADGLVWTGPAYVRGFDDARAIEAHVEPMTGRTRPIRKNHKTRKLRLVA